MAEAHPVGFQWVMEAKARGAKVIHVDPRFTRTSALADTYVPLRAGTDIAFLGGVINYVLRERARLPRLRRGLHQRRDDRQRGLRATPRTSTGCSPGSTRRPRTYDPTTWQYAGAGGHGRQRTGQDHADAARDRQRAAARDARRRASQGDPQRDETLQHPRCVYQILKRHFARYTPEMVEQTCGISPETFLEVCRGLDGELRPRAHHRAGLQRRLDPAQRRRAVHPHRRDPPAAARQHGPPRRRHHGAARARQHPGLDRHPDAVQPAARLPADAATPHEHDDARRRGSTASATPAPRASGASAGAYGVNLLKAYWGDAATAGQRLLLRLPAQDHRRPRHLPHRAGHDRRQGQGLLPARPEPRRRLGPRPGAAARHGQPRLARRARPVRDRERDVLEGLARDRDRRDRARGVPHRGVPAARRPPTSRRRAPSPRPSGCCSGARRRSSRRATAAPSCGSSTTWAGWSGSGWPAPPTSATGRCSTWPGTTPTHGETDEPSAEAVLKEINGYEVATGRPLSTFTEMKDDGSTARRLLDLHRRLHGRRQPGRPAQARAASSPGWRPEWGWAWPANRRILYNRASADPEGKPWSERKAYVWWDRGGEAGEWTGHDVPDFEMTKPPSYRPPEGADGVEAHRRRRPVHHAGRRQGLAVRARRAWSTGRCRRTTSRSSRRSATRCTASRPTRPARSTSARTTGSTRARRRSTARSSRSSSRPAG